ncbi:MAG: GTP cyclohydrolase II [Chloroflexi bacterium]|nr:MAG: GTP cyclohydrolase II [Chloroflexota bacterium]
MSDVQPLAQTILPTSYGVFHMAVFAGDNVALWCGDVKAQTPLLRLHSECLTGDVFGSLKCDCGEQLDAALQRIQTSGCGVLLYLRQEGRGIGLVNKIKAYALQETGLDTVDANRALGLPDDMRDYTLALGMLEWLGVTKVHLLTNNPTKISALSSSGVHVVSRESIEMSANTVNHDYLQTKKIRMGHLLKD